MMRSVVVNINTGEYWSKEFQQWTNILYASVYEGFVHWDNSLPQEDEYMFLPISFTPEPIGSTPHAFEVM